MPGSAASFMTEPGQLPTTTLAVRAQRIRFVASSPAPAVAQFTHPTRKVAIAEPLNPTELFSSAPPSAPSPDTDQFILVVVPAGAATPMETQRQVESWMHAVAPGSPPTVEILLRSERVLWRAGQAAIFGTPERCDELAPGLIEFAFYEGELQKLERELEQYWPAAESDAALTHAVGQPELAQQSHVNELTAGMARRRIRFARLEPCLEKASIALPGPARRLAGELAMQAEVLDRLGWVDDRLEVFENLYELANDRLTEFTYFNREFRLELWIIVLLVMEVIIMGLDLWYTIRDSNR